MRNYLFNIIQALVMECGPFLAPGTVRALYSFRYPPDWRDADDQAVAVAIQTNIAEYDAAIFLRRHGCDGLIATHMFESIDRYLSSAP